MTGNHINRLLTVIERFASVAERWADVEYPKHDENTQEAELYKQGERREANTPQEYNELPDDPPGRFERTITSKNTA
jgi:hypothetical protein